MQKRQREVEADGCSACESFVSPEAAVILLAKRGKLQESSIFMFGAPKNDETTTGRKR